MRPPRGNLLIALLLSQIMFIAVTEPLADNGTCPHGGGIVIMLIPSRFV